MTDALKQKFEAALALQQQGQIAEAERGYREVAAADPKHFLSRYNLGVLLYSRGLIADSERCFAEAAAIVPDLAEAALAHAKVLQDLKRNREAVASYDRLLARKPDNANAWCDRGTALLSDGHADEALASFDRSLALAPGHLVALFNRATVLIQKKRNEEALETIGRALALKPDFVEALQVQGTVLRALGRSEAALRSFDEVLKLRPATPDALNNRGAVLLDLARHADALATFDQALALNPNSSEALVNRGRALGKLGRTEEELATYNAAIAARPDFAEAYTSRGNFFVLQHRHAEAIKDLRHALALQPGHIAASHALGNVLMAEGDREGALAAFDTALASRPDYVEALNNKGIVLRALNRQAEAMTAFDAVLRLKPDYPYAGGAAFTCRVHTCDWANYAATAQRLVEGVRAGKPVDNPFSFLAYAPEPQDQLACAHNYITAKGAPPVMPPGPRPAGDKIRIAYITADLHNHATAYLMAGLWESHDRARFEVHGVSLSGGDDSSIGARVRAGFDSLIDGQPLSDVELARRIRDLGIDVAIDLKGYTKEARPNVFLMRPAPVQAAFLGYPGTFGHPCMDYVVADRIIIPPEHHAFFSEKVVYLPDCYQPTDRTRAISARVPTRAEAGLPEAGFVFCSFNGNYKVTPDVFDVWMRLVKAVPGSVLWLFKSNPVAEANLRREAAARGVDGQRLVFAGVQPSADHLARHRLADLFLDTLPINAHTTASDALWAGLPLVTCLGRSFVGRVAASVLTAAGLPELVTQNLADYEALALRLATQPAALAGVKAKLAANRATCALFDTDRFRKHLETAYATMWDRHRRGEPPASFSVQPAYQSVVL